uniref:Uncharacterized protein n=1 Tax=Pyramimonas obovata TaxID=1411642 RepID=A0A7S0QUT8_9CHLO|mmetsp:Transcript_21646/g.47554  ORF Transcript_21646/g.47554 Transcript_21646/m.47554 type:complete len:526 (+) Transcript_21646:875-2452(+)
MAGACAIRFQVVANFSGVNRTRQTSNARVPLYFHRCNRAGIPHDRVNTRSLPSIIRPSLTVGLRAKKCTKNGGRRALSVRSGFDANTAWSVTGAAIAPTLFQASLLPYLGFLYFVGRPEAKTPPLANVGFRFLLCFVAATIPAGVIAKNQYGDILANVDIMHGSAESLLTVTNILILLGMRQGLRQLQKPDGESDASSGIMLWAATALGIAGLLGAHVTGFDTAAVATLGMEPTNALSWPTWAVHVSSVTEWALAMQLIWLYADAVNIPQWKGLTWAMVPSLASGLSACTFHLFYNPSELTPLVTLQSGLTLLGNTTLCLAALRISQASASPALEPPLPAAAAPAEAEADSDSDAAFVLKLLLLSAGGGALVKAGSVAAGLPDAQPSLALAAAIILTATAASCSPWLVGQGDEGEEGGFDKVEMMANIKSFGVAGTLSYVITELVFWALALPGAIFGYHYTTGEWLSLQTDRAQIAGIAAAFVTGVRFLVPVRMGVALALIPTCDRLLVQPFLGTKGEEEGGGEQ